MIDENELEARLRSHFGGQRAQDAVGAPAFGSMVARARAGVAATPTVLVPRWTRRRVIAWSAPLLVAAGLGAVLIIPDRLKDQEFDRTVAEWSRTEATFRSPTDGLLAVPGSEFLGRGPSVTGPVAGRGS
jgi:hypothetical protein